VEKDQRFFRPQAPPPPWQLWSRETYVRWGASDSWLHNHAVLLWVVNLT
jgi:hypothetical protein